MWDRSRVRLLVAVFLIAAVVVICISPAVDLPETALRAKQDALRIAMAIIALATAMVGLVIPLTEIGWLASCSRFPIARPFPARCRPSSSLLRFPFASTAIDA